MVKKKKINPKDNRRKAQRLPISLKVFCRQKDKEDTFQAKTKDISGVGVGLFAAQPLPKGAKIGILILADKKLNPGEKIEFKFSGRKQYPGVFPVTGKIVWSHKVAKDKYQAGLVFEKVDNWNEFIQFFCEKLIDFSIE